MEIPVSFTFNVEMNFDPKTTEEEFLGRVSNGVMEVSKFLAELVDDYIDNWTHRPNFIVRPVKRSLAFNNLTSFEGGVDTNDKIFQWVSLGVEPYSFISKNVMHFPYHPKTRYMSYISKTDTGIEGDSKDLRSGRWRKTNFIDERDIRARDIPMRAKAGKRELIDDIFTFEVFGGR